jgi:hypothetical protein
MLGRIYGWWKVFMSESRSLLGDAPHGNGRVPAQRSVQDSPEK